MTDSVAGEGVATTDELEDGEVGGSTVPSGGGLNIELEEGEIGPVNDGPLAPADTEALEDGEIPDLEDGEVRAGPEVGEILGGVSSGYDPGAHGLAFRPKSVGDPATPSRAADDVTFSNVTVPSPYASSRVPRSCSPWEKAMYRSNSLIEHVAVRRLSAPEIGEEDEERWDRKQMLAFEAVQEMQANDRQRRAAEGGKSRDRERFDMGRAHLHRDRTSDGEAGRRSLGARGDERWNPDRRRDERNRDRDRDPGREPDRRRRDDRQDTELSDERRKRRRSRDASPSQLDRDRQRERGRTGRDHDRVRADAFGRDRSGGQRDDLDQQSDANVRVEKRSRHSRFDSERNGSSRQSDDDSDSNEEVSLWCHF